MNIKNLTGNILQFKEERAQKLFRQVKEAGHIALGSVKLQAQDPSTYTVAVIAGTIQGLKYEGNFKRGVKAGAAMYVTMMGTNAIYNIIRNMDDIKNA